MLPGRWPSTIGRVLVALLFLTMSASGINYLLDSSGGYLLDEEGGRVVLVGDVHSLSFRSDWGTGQHISAVFDVNSDHSGIGVSASAVDDNSPVTETEIVHVLPSGVFVSLQKCNAPRCEVNWPRESMTDGQANEVLFYMTNAVGARYGASTRISKP